MLSPLGTVEFVLPFRRSFRARSCAFSLSHSPDGQRGCLAGVPFSECQRRPSKQNKAQRQNARFPPRGVAVAFAVRVSRKIAAHRLGFSVVSRSLRNIASIVDLSSQILHDQAATSALLWCIGVLALWHHTPYGDDHVISGAVAVGNDAFAGLADGDTFSFKVFTETVVKLGKAAQLQVCHALLVLLDLGRVADITGSVLRHVGGVGGI